MPYKDPKKRYAAQQAYYERNKKTIAAKQKEKARLRRAQLVEEAGGACVDCGVSYPAHVFDFHHRNPEEKEFSLSASPTSSMARLRKEAAKCDLLCANCHRLRHGNKESPGA